MTDVLIVGLVASFPPSLVGAAALVSSLKNRKKLEEVHVLVNSRLTKALEKIDSLELKLQKLTGQAPTGEPA